STLLASCTLPALLVPPLPPHHRPPSVFFFLMIPPPPRSTLFPYTTLFRSSRGCRCGSRSEPPRRPECWEIPVPASGRPGVTGRRSEEHTSELQSLTNLVCRLLLEKKKKNDTHPHTSSSYALVHLGRRSDTA